MAYSRAPALRNLVGCRGTRWPGPSSQRRWAQVHDVWRFRAATQTRGNSSSNVLDKYRDKLDAKARQEGHADFEQLRKAYADRIQQQRCDTVVSSPASSPLSSLSSSSTTSSLPPTPTAAAATAATAATAAAASSSSSTAVKPLSAILDLDKARALPAAELTAIWRLRHAGQENSLCAVIPAATYAAMEAAARAHPQFVLPVPHAGRGAELHFLQWTFDAASATSTVLFTRLAEYKLRREFALPHTTVTHHLDLARDGASASRLVLMQGQTVDGRGVAVHDARWLVMCLQRFYGAWTAATAGGEGVGPTGEAYALERAVERRRLLEWFAAGDERFTVERLIEEAERMG